MLEWLPCPPPGDLPDPGIKLESPALADGFFTDELPGKPSEGIKLLKLFKIQCPLQEQLRNNLAYFDITDSVGQKQHSGA